MSCVTVLWTGPGPDRLSEKSSVLLSLVRLAIHKVDTCYLYRFSTLHGAPVTLVMKNIAISGTWRLAMQGSNITTAIVDIDRACLWIASERLNADADVEMDIYRKGLPDDSYETEDVSASLKVPRPWVGPARRYRFTTTAGSTH